MFAGAGCHSARTEDLEICPHGFRKAVLAIPEEASEGWNNECCFLIPDQTHKGTVKIRIAPPSKKQAVCNI
jgi:hypothetical protein